MVTVPGLFCVLLRARNQKPRLIVSGPRKDAKPSVNDNLHSYTVTACLKFGMQCRMQKYNKANVIDQVI